MPKRRPARKRAGTQRAPVANKTAAKKSDLKPEIRAAAKQGFKLFPVEARGKKPMVKSWQKVAASDPEQLEMWATQFPGCNWGMVTGASSGVVVVDIDGPGGMASVAAWEAAGQFLPKTRTHKTGNGKHYLFKCPPDGIVRNSAGRIAPGTDIRGDGGYVVSPPSVHPNGTRYEVIDNSSPAHLPDWLLQKVRLPEPYKSRAIAAGEIPEGRRNVSLTSIAGTMRAAGMPPAVIEAKLLAVNLEQCKPPLPESEVHQIAKSAEKWPVPDEMQAVLNDPRPKVRLPGDNWLLSQTAAEVGRHLAPTPLFVHDGEIAAVDGGELRHVTAQTFRTLVYLGVKRPFSDIVHNTDNLFD
jgi:Bifunctional DNA primase/polymerase, N-terminal/Primase C terminal 1 (PriCT-1)